MAVSGAAMQALFRNPLAEPGLIGITAGGALGAVGAIVLTAGGFWITAPAAFAGSLLATLCAYAVGRRVPGVAGLLLAGVAITAVAFSLIGLLTFMANDAQLRDLTFWNMGSLARANWTLLAFLGPWVALLSAWMMTQWRAMNALLLGEREAQHLGYALKPLRVRLVLASALIIGPLVAVTGSIVFVGLVVPHLARMTLGANHRWLLPASVAGGGLALVLADWASRVALTPAELPIGLITDWSAVPSSCGCWRGAGGSDDAGRRKPHPVARWRARAGPRVAGAGAGRSGGPAGRQRRRQVDAAGRAGRRVARRRGRVAPGRRGSVRHGARAAGAPARRAAAETGAGLRPGRGRGGGDGRLPFPELPPAAVEALVDRTLALADATHLRARRYPELSGGEQQRVQFARVLTQCLAARAEGEARYLLLDEPTASLDPRHQGELLRVAVDLARDERVGVLVILHDMNLAARWCDRLLLLGGGRAIASGPPSQVLTPASLHLAYGIAAQVVPHPLAPGRVLVLTA